MPKTPSTLPRRRSQSVDRSRPATAGAGSYLESIVAVREALRTTTRSLSVSFQGESFFFQTSKAKHTPRKPDSGCRKSTTPSSGAENSQPSGQNLRRRPPARARDSTFVSKSLDFSVDGKDPLLVTVRLLGDCSLSLDTDSRSPNCNSNLPESGVPEKVRSKPRGVVIPARFHQENGCPRPRLETPQKPITAKQQTLANTQLSSPRSLPSPPCEPIKPSFPRESGTSRVRSNIMERYPNANAPSILSFASEVRRTKKGESRIEDAHMLRLFHNRYMQWRHINARAEKALSTKQVNTTNNFYNAWINVSEMRNSNVNKRIKVQVLMQSLKLASILNGQINPLEECSTLDKDHEGFLIAAIKALKASTLRLPIVGGAKVDIQEVKDAVHSAVVLMQTISSSICFFTCKEEISSQVAELTQAAALERALLDQSSHLLSIVAALHVKQCSLRGCILQLGRKTSVMQLH
ncbi:hypothetical protein HPP92_019133 [Vanilla planifolia]|uniref:Uncharacterized protein n=1 Tax=Vanilla planifolia TaxID=51239 RepID=A0A835Q8F2_VANPL|nr:hypothetical protein HPP92_019133 [Vanilla planifolia]